MCQSTHPASVPGGCFSVGVRGGESGGELQGQPQEGEEEEERRARSATGKTWGWRTQALGLSSKFAIVERNHSKLAIVKFYKLTCRGQSVRSQPCTLI